MILYIGNPKDATKKLFKLVNRFNKVAEYKINTQKSVVFLYTNNFQKKKLKNNPIYNCIKKKKIPENKFNQGGERAVYA